MAAGLDASDIRILGVPHPLGGTDEDTVRQWADDAVDKTLSLFGADVADSAESNAAPPASAGGTDAIDVAVAAVRELVALDGGDVELIDFDGSDARLRLVLETVECQECVMPAEFLEQVALSKMQAHLPDLVAVHIEDPRDA